MLHMFIHVPGENENIVDDDEPVPQVSNNIIYKCLGGNGDAEGHHKVFKMAKGVLKDIFHSSPSWIVMGWHAGSSWRG